MSVEVCRSGPGVERDEREGLVGGQPAAATAERDERAGGRDVTIPGRRRAGAPSALHRAVQRVGIEHGDRAVSADVGREAVQRLRIRAAAGSREIAPGQERVDRRCNQLLCCLRDPRATHVAGFRAWLKLGYCVRRGETSHIRIWAPCPPSKNKLQAWRNAGAIAADKPRTYFRLEAVFSATQVEPLPPPAEPAPFDPPMAELEGDSLLWAREPLERLGDELGYSVTYRTLATGHGGSCAPAAKLLTINDDQAVNAQISVLCPWRSCCIGICPNGFE